MEKTNPTISTAENVAPADKKIAVMGFGNPTRSDDAIGIYVIEQLQNKIGNREDISLLDMGTGAFEILFKLKGHQKIIVVDAVMNTGEKPGTLFKVPASELEASIQDDPLVFLHSLKWDQALSYAKKILREEYPQDIQAYLIAVDNIKMDIQLSDEVRKGGDEVVERIINHEI